MNLILENKLQNSMLSEKDKYEIRNFFIFLTDEKKINLIHNFDIVISSILKIHQDLKQQQMILLWKTISNIENNIKNAQYEGLKKASIESIWDLKNEI